MSNNDLSDLTSRISGPQARAWDVGDEASRRIASGADDIIHLGVGDPDLDTPKHIRDALHSAVEGGKTHYAPLAGELALREAIANNAEGLYGPGISPDNVIVCNGAQGALFLTFLTLTGPGDEVIVLEPYYAPYPAVVRAGGATMVSVALDQQKDYALDLEKIKAAITDKTRAILINSPSNPAGVVFDHDEIAKLTAFCHANDIWIITDEVYWSLCFDAPHVSAYGMAEYRDKIVVINSLSKSHAMTGWRLGWAIGPTHFIAAMTDLNQAAQFGINQFVQTAAITAIRENDFISDFNALFKARRDAFCHGLRQSNLLSFSTPRGGMFVLVDISATGLDGRDFAEKLLDAEGVATVPGFGFGESCNGTIRIGYLCDEETLREAARRIVRFAESCVE